MTEVCRTSLWDESGELTVLADALSNIGSIILCFASMDAIHYGIKRIIICVRAYQSAAYKSFNAGETDQSQA